MLTAVSGTVRVVHVRLRAAGEQVTAEARDLLVSGVGSGGQSERTFGLVSSLCLGIWPPVVSAALAWDER